MNRNDGQIFCPHCGAMLPTCGQCRCQWYRDWETIYIICATSKTGCKTWFNSMYYIQVEDHAQPVVRCVNRREKALEMTIADAEKVLPEVKACYPDAQIAAEERGEA